MKPFNLKNEKKQQQHFSVPKHFKFQDLRSGERCRTHGPSVIIKMSIIMPIVLQLKSFHDDEY